MEISVSKGFPRVGLRGAARRLPKARAHEEVGDCVRALHLLRGRFAGTLGHPEQRGRAPRAGRRKPAPPSGRPQCGRLARRTRLASPLSGRRPAAPGKAGEARGTQGPESRFWMGRDAAPEQSRETWGRLVSRKS